MTQWLAGMRITAARLNDFTPVAGTGTVTPATNFTVTSFTSFDAGGTTEWELILAYSGSTLTASSKGVITETLAATLPFGPNGNWQGFFSTSNFYGGGFFVRTNGQIELINLYPTATLSSGDSLTLSGAFATG